MVATWMSVMVGLCAIQIPDSMLQAGSRIADGAAKGARHRIGDGIGDGGRTVQITVKVAEEIKTTLQTIAAAAAVAAVMYTIQAVRADAREEKRLRLSGRRADEHREGVPLSDNAARTAAPAATEDSDWSDMSTQPVLHCAPATAPDGGPAVMLWVPK
jgi:hypothetical protein